MTASDGFPIISPPKKCAFGAGFRGKPDQAHIAHAFPESNLPCRQRQKQRRPAKSGTRTEMVIFAVKNSG